MTRRRGAASWRGRPLGRSLALVLLLLFTVAGCEDDGTAPEEAEDDVRGTWVAIDGSFTAYLVITSTTLTQYLTLNDGCYDAYPFEIVDRSGATFTIREAGADAEIRLTIRLEGDDLRVIVSGEPDGFLYSPTTEDPSGFQACIEPGDPSLSCEALSRVEIGVPVDGELETTDARAMYLDPYYDLYGLRLGGSAEVELTVTSDAFDTVLVVFSAGGTYIGDNDDIDFPVDTNSRLNLELESGCYRVMVTTATSGDIGSYTLTVN